MSYMLNSSSCGGEVIVTRPRLPYVAFARLSNVICQSNQENPRYLTKSESARLQRFSLAASSKQESGRRRWRRNGHRCVNPHGFGTQHWNLSTSRTSRPFFRLTILLLSPIPNGIRRGIRGHWLTSKSLGIWRPRMLISQMGFCLRALLPMWLQPWKVLCSFLSLFPRADIP